MTEPFCHLHVHTQFSPLDGVASPLDLMNECKARDWPAIAFTDHGNMATVPDAYFASQETGVKYIAGCELYFNDLHPFWVQYQKDGHTIAELKRGNEEDVKKAENIRKNRHITVLCKNMVGYRNLLQLMQVGWSEGFYYKPRIWMDALDKHKEGLIVLTGCLNGPISWEVRNQDKSALIQVARRMMEVMGSDLYLEFQMPGKDIENSLEVFNVLAAIRRKFKLNGVITNDVHYVTKKDFHLQKVLMAIDQNTNLADPEFWCIDSDYLYLKTREELRETFYEDGFDANMAIGEFEELCDNTIVVAEKCDTFKPDLSPKLPSIPDADAKLIIAVQQALKDKGLDGEDAKKYLMDGREVTHAGQSGVELRRIIEKGFSSYFLIMSDIITHATKNLDAQIGPARGSAGGSLICYLLGIHHIDPLKWGAAGGGILSFDRFLSPSRGGHMLNIKME